MTDRAKAVDVVLRVAAVLMPMQDPKEFEQYFTEVIRAGQTGGELSKTFGNVVAKGGMAREMGLTQIAFTRKKGSPASTRPIMSGWATHVIGLRQLPGAEFELIRRDALHVSGLSKHGPLTLSMTSTPGGDVESAEFRWDERVPGPRGTIRELLLRGLQYFIPAVTAAHLDGVNSGNELEAGGVYVRMSQQETVYTISVTTNKD